MERDEYSHMKSESSGGRKSIRNMVSALSDRANPQRKRQSVQLGWAKNSSDFGKGNTTTPIAIERERFAHANSEPSVADMSMQSMVSVQSDHDHPRRQRQSAQSGLPSSDFGKGKIEGKGGDTGTRDHGRSASTGPYGNARGEHKGKRNDNGGDSGEGQNEETARSSSPGANDGKGKGNGEHRRKRENEKSARNSSQGATANRRLDNEGKGKSVESARSSSPDVHENHRCDDKGKGKGKGKQSRNTKRNDEEPHKNKRSANCQNGFAPAAQFIMMVGLSYQVLADIEDVSCVVEEKEVEQFIIGAGLVGRVVNIDSFSGDAEIDFGESLGIKLVRTRDFSKLKQTYTRSPVTHAVDVDDLLFNKNPASGLDDSCSMCTISGPAGSRPREGGNQKLMSSDSGCRYPILHSFFVQCREWWGEEVLAD
jgi:hypothetical protein